MAEGSNVIFTRYIGHSAEHELRIEIPAVRSEIRHQRQEIGNCCAAAKHLKGR